MFEILHLNPGDSINLDFLEIVKNMTSSPGVYLMKNKQGVIIYVGKAKNLKKRLFSYFNKSVKTTKTQHLVRDIADLETIITLTESEALFLEYNLIKEHQPKYNIKLKHSPFYPFVAINMSQAAPYFEVKYYNTDKNYQYFGPYPQKQLAYEYVSFLNDTFKLRSCSNQEFKSRTRPCLLYQMNKCSAPCVKKISPEDYQERVKSAVKVLKGHATDLENNLKLEMQSLVEVENFEHAAQLRDTLKALSKLKEKQQIITSQLDDKYVLNYCRAKGVCHIGMIKIKKGQVQDLEVFEVEDFNPQESPLEYIEEVLVNVFSEEMLAEVVIPEDLAIPNLEPLKLKIRHPKRYEKSLLEMIAVNLHQEGENPQIPKLLDLQQTLGLDKMPVSMECMDISHFQGSYTVASKVRFEQGVKEKNGYRKYKIKTVEGIDDFASIAEVVRRRFSNDQNFPDLLIIDGGLGQVQAAVRVMEELNIQGVCVVGLAKDRTESDFTKSEVKTSGERVVFPDGREILLSPRTGAYQLMTSIRNEAHRFAIKFHRELRSKNFLLK